MRPSCTPRSSTASWRRSRSSLRVRASAPSHSRHWRRTLRPRSATFSCCTRAVSSPSDLTCVFTRLFPPLGRGLTRRHPRPTQVELPLEDLSAFLGDALQWSLATSTTFLQLKSMFHLYASLVNKHCDRAFFCSSPCASLAARTDRARARPMQDCNRSSSTRYPPSGRPRSPTGRPPASDGRAPSAHGSGCVPPRSYGRPRLARLRLTSSSALAALPRSARSQPRARLYVPLAAARPPGRRGRRAAGPGRGQGARHHRRGRRRRRPDQAQPRRHPSPSPFSTLSHCRSHG